MAALTPWAAIPDLHKPDGKTSIFGTEVAREGIKLPSKQCDIVTNSFKNRDSIMTVKHAISSGEPWVSERDTLGMTIRRWGVTWKLNVM